jgi:glycosyltransferase involved in cell wall biosynthesis
MHAPRAWEMEVATTCALDHVAWANVLEPGTANEDGLRVHRFAVGPRNQERYEEIHSFIADGTATYAQELEWLAQSVWAPDLHEFLSGRGDAYDLIVFSPYLFGTTVWGTNVRPQRSVLMPCLHDEPYAHLKVMKRLFQSARGCIFNSPPEQSFALRLYGPVSGFVVGMGFDPPATPPAVGFADQRGLGKYVLYAGRLEEGKRVDVAVNFAVRYARERPSAPKLVLVGSGSYRIPRAARDVVEEVGFLEEGERRAAYREALALVNPSHLESLSLVLLEAWLEETPALVAQGSDVLRYHCEQSGGGFVFGSYEEYRNALDRLDDDQGLRDQMGRDGAAYVQATYGWPTVRSRLQTAVEHLAS